MAQQTRLRVGKQSHISLTNDAEWETIVKYHHTNIVNYNKETIMLDYGNWPSVSTKANMNRASCQFNLGYEVHSKDFDWYALYKGEKHWFDMNSQVRLTR